MSFDVNFFARDYSIEGPRSRTSEAAAVLARIVAEHGAQDDEDVFTDTDEASAGIAIRSLQPGHCSLIYEVCAQNGWVAVFASGPDEHVALAASAFKPEEETVFSQVFGIEAATIVGSPADAQVAIEAAFKSWNDGAGFAETGQREEKA